MFQSECGVRGLKSITGFKKDTVIPVTRARINRSYREREQERFDLASPQSRPRHENHFLGLASPRLVLGREFLVFSLKVIIKN